MAITKRGNTISLSPGWLSVGFETFKTDFCTRQLIEMPSFLFTVAIRFSRFAISSPSFMTLLVALCGAHFGDMKVSGGLSKIQLPRLARSGGCGSSGFPFSAPPEQTQRAVVAEILEEIVEQPRYYILDKRLFYAKVTSLPERRERRQRGHKFSPALDLPAALT